MKLIEQCSLVENHLCDSSISSVTFFKKAKFEPVGVAFHNKCKLSLGLVYVIFSFDF